MTVQEALAATRSSAAGLAKADAQERIRQNGYNRLTPGATRTIFHMIWDQLYNIITGILLGAAIIAGIFSEWIELGFILAVILANVVIGVIQEGKAAAATKAITSMVTATAIVLRNQRKVTLPAAELVQGDVLFMAPGDRVPADLRLLESNSLRVIESVLTGESTGITKYTDPVRPDAQLGDRTCMAFMGTLVTSGDGIGLVVGTGDNAEIGRINTLMSSVKAGKTPLQAQVSHFGFRLSLCCIVVAIITFLVAYFGRNEATEDALRFAVGVAVALIPEGLPTVVTITLALGVQVMARHHAIVRQLPAVETLGAVTCICSDKTGTLTKNEMTAVRMHTAGMVLAASGTGYQPNGDITLSGPG
jgi:P-type E1-E2 ATPase